MGGSLVMSFYVALNDVFLHGKCWYSEKLMMESGINAYTVRNIRIILHGLYRCL
jgi:hypothetical protein